MANKFFLRALHFINAPYESAIALLADDGKYDLLTTVIHELSHLYGFIDGYAGFDESLETENGTTKFIGDDFDATLDGEHLDKSAHPYDLLNTHLALSDRAIGEDSFTYTVQGNGGKCCARNHRNSDSRKYH